MNALKMCLNWKVITGAAVVTVGLLAFAPSLATAAVPFLVLAICPLSMILMMAMMSGSKRESDAACSTVSTNAGSSRLSETPAEQLTLLEAQQQDLARQVTAMETDAIRISGTHRGEASAAARP